MFRTLRILLLFSSLFAGSHLFAASEAVLLFVTAPGCPACVQSAPLVQQLAAEGYPVETVDAAQYPELVRDQLKVDTFPTFLMYADEKIIDRVVGGGNPTTLKPRILYMFEKIKKDSFAVPPPASLSLPEPPVASLASSVPNSVPHSSFVYSSVKLRVDAENTHSWGTGTIIDARKGEALILTCGHIFRDSQGKGNVEVHLFGDNSGQRVLGRCLFYDLNIDLALVTIKPPCPVKGAAIAPASYSITPNQKVWSVGCDGGANPTVWEHQILSTDKIGAAIGNTVPFHYIQVSNAPVSGRSGGGLFSADGYLLGICVTADPAENDGQFVPPEMIRLVLQKLELTDIYEKPSLQDSESKMQTAAVFDNSVNTPPPLELQPLKTAEEVRAVSPVPSLNAKEQATLEEINRRAQDGDEIILIVRSRRNPEVPSDVIVLNGTSEQFLKALKSQPLHSAKERIAADSGNYNPVILSSHESVPATSVPTTAAQPPSGPRPVSFPVLH